MTLSCNHLDDKITENKVNKLLDKHIIQRLTFSHKCPAPVKKRAQKAATKEKAKTYKYNEMIEHLRECQESLKL